MNRIELTDAELMTILFFLRDATPGPHWTPAQRCALDDARGKLENAYSADMYEDRTSPRGDREDFHSDG